MSASGATLRLGLTVTQRERDGLQYGEHDQRRPIPRAQRAGSSPVHEYASEKEQEHP